MNQKDWTDLKKWLLVAGFTVVLFWALFNPERFWTLVGRVFSLFSPLIIAIGAAFVLNLLMKLFEERLFAPLNRRNPPGWARARRPLSLSLTFLTVGLAIVLLTGFLIPQLSRSIASLVANYDTYRGTLEAFVADLLQRYPMAQSIIDRVSENWADIAQRVGAFVTGYIPQFFSYTVQLTTGVFNLVTGIILSVYLLYNKEKNLRILKKMVFAYLPRRVADRAVEVAALVNRAFSSFIGGQITEAIILGVLCFIGMSLLRMPYPLLVSVLIGVTGLIPIFGAFMGTIPSAFLILMVDPPMAFWFIVFIIVLQQIESNIIYPRVVGSSIGLGGMWVLLALLFGGSLFGFMGMLLGAPTCAVVYALVRRAANRRLEERGIDL